MNEKEVAEMLSCSLQTLRNDRSKGIGLPYVKLGRLVRYSLNDVIEYVENHKILTAQKCGNS
jgi:hypothetical protein